MLISPIFKNNFAKTPQNQLPFKCKECTEFEDDSFTLSRDNEGSIDHNHELRRINEKYASTRAILARMLDNGDLKSVGEYTCEMDKLNKKEQAETLQAHSHQHFS